MTMPSANRKKAATPPSSSKYAKETRGNAAPFTPMPLDHSGDMKLTGKGGIDATPKAHSGRDETGTGKCDEA